MSIALILAARDRRGRPACRPVLKPFSIEPTIQVNRVESSSGNFTTKLYRTRLDYGFSPLMFASALALLRQRGKGSAALLQKESLTPS
jgi:hypothetical protein